MDARARAARVGTAGPSARWIVTTPSASLMTSAAADVSAAPATGSAIPAEFRLVTNPICPFAQRASIALVDSGAPYELEIASLTEKPAWFTELYLKAEGADKTSNGKVPILHHRTSVSARYPEGYVLTESAVIVDYLTAAVDFPARLRTPYEVAVSRLLQEGPIALFVKSFYGVLREPDVAAATVHGQNLYKAAVGLVEQLRVSGGPYLFGDRFTVPDILVTPFLVRYPILQHYAGLELPDTPETAAFEAYRALVTAHPAVVETSKPVQYYIDGYVSYAPAGVERKVVVPAP